MTIDDERRVIAQSLDHLAAHMVTKDELAGLLAEAVAEGIRAAASNPEVWAAAREAVTKQATTAAGDMVLGGVASLLKRGLWIGCAAVAIYSAFGWPAVVAAWKALTAGGQTP